MRIFLAMTALACLTSTASLAQEANCANPTSQVEMTYCAGVAHDEADVELNAAYKKAIAQAKAQDAHIGSDQIPSRSLLRDAQRSWIKFRDEACSAESTLFRGGTAQSMLFLDCMTRLTKRRTEDLLLFAETN